MIWSVDARGYDIVKRSSVGVDADDDFEEHCIVPKGGMRRLIDVALLQKEIFIDLANSASRPGPVGILEFMKWNGDRPRPVLHFLDVRRTCASLCKAILTR